jgi:hypothetical protein
LATASEWSASANVRFVESASPAAEVRLRFTSSNTSWARIGTTYRDAYAAPESASVSLGNVSASTPPDSFRAVVLHEFGHTLGLIHEHPQPGSALDWNEVEAIDYFARTYAWSEQDVRMWVFGRYELADVSEGRYDSLSIMHYPLPGALTYSGRGAPFNHELSARDRRFIALAYPR